MARADPIPAPQRLDRTGLIQGLAAYVIWGVLPLFFWLLTAVDAGEVVAMRVLWSLGLLAVLVVALQRGPALLAALRNRRAMLLLTASAALISANWLVFIWAIQHHHVLEASLGYFLNPLVNVLLGVVLLRERLGKPQMAAVALAAIGVTVLAIGAGQGIWISLSLAFSFGLYGYVRKIAPVEALEGLTIETVILAPIAAIYVFWLSRHGDLSFGSKTAITAILIASGVVTAMPLLLFSSAARRLPYSTLGLLQYIAPTMGFVLAITFFGETMTLSHAICFALIWSGLAIYVIGNVVQHRRQAAVTAIR